MNTLTTLFVDDEKDFLETILKRMKKRHVNAYGAESGEEALSLLAHTPVDVVVLDIRMPGMDGIETLKEIKKRLPLVEVILLTGHASLEAAREGMESGAFDFMMKPVNIDELLYKLQDAHKNKSIQESKIKHLESKLKR
ncbi:MAG TPA: response regulator [Deltaproteobacteria bacterium]|nr:response regulator [Deltaproteobacteria bacterium]